jgi:hypothetical protein
MTLRTPVGDRVGIEHPVCPAGMGEVDLAERAGAPSDAFTGSGRESASSSASARESVSAP